VEVRVRHPKSILAVPLLASVVSLGCASPDEDTGGQTTSPFGTGIGGEESGSGQTGDGDADSGDGDADSGGESDSSADDGAPKYDVDSDEGPAPGCGAGDGECGCDAVDLLFVIDNSGSMQPYQEALADTFPEFVDAMIGSLPAGTDLHVGISSTSFGSPSAGGKGSSGCSNAQYDAEAMANHYPPPSQPNGQNGGQGRLYEYQGKRFYAQNTSDDPSGLEAWFTGAAISVGEQGSNWEMVSAGGAWVTHPDNEAHNAGFLRDAGAVLVVFVLTDEFDNSPEDAGVYHDLVVAAKQQCGGDTCVVAGGMAPPCVPDTPDNVLNEFLSSFGSDPIWGDIGAENDTSHYPDVLGNALAQVIAETCEQIPPVG
jgi:hypothetical protein